MSTLFLVLLITHVIFGMIGLMSSFITSFLLIKMKATRTKLLSYSFLAFFSYLVSWLAGGWYYWKYYGSVVKPIIVKGEYIWAHQVFMETKEHVFLFLPFATLTLAVIILFKYTELKNDSSFKNHVLIFSLVITLIALFITISGILVSGGAQ
ncbi:hypothetical protein COZ82_00380 [Candidatus Kaiserbacteria bacterium CG_4_8_14_3_um_filter_38_9]|uniref:Uncharacterized protein n=1 Tax=Candidatus Kaiserbacteria bacterium CG_4_8_14_3_um_filter_38_9 TaxID=1974599 RepID=A0A2M7IPT2_9BACT|nr:MAG: hypothetical protein COZ82_00380 [Candidatus Kaiserbacteria bacterium CG_4_8_14_3_um_filter_38_9]